MPQANGSDKLLGYVLETTPGVTPASAVFKELPHISCDLGSTYDQLKARNIRANRTPSPSRRGNATLEGTLVADAQPDTYDDLLKMFMRKEWVSNELTIGTERFTAAIEEGLDFGSTTEYRVFNGVEVESLSLEVGTEEQVAFTFGLMGLTESDFSTTSADANSAYTAATPKDFFWHVDGSFLENGAAIGYLNSITLDGRNNLAGSRALGTDGYRNITAGEASVSGKIGGLLESTVLFNKMKNNTTTSFAFTLEAGAETLTFAVNGVKLTNGRIVTESNRGVTFEFDYEASGDNALVITRV